jgi:hypothetical protein
MKSIQEIYPFVNRINFYIKNEYPKWYEEFNNCKNSTNIDYALTDCFMSDKTIPYAAGIVIDILKMKHDKT